MTDAPIRFPDYGDSGDSSGARRTRRAFRFCVLSCLLMTFVMWYAESSRLAQEESLYLSGVTLERDSGRVMLKQAIRIDEQKHDVRTPKYVQALAVRATDDVALQHYADAMALEPTNSLFAIRYGVRLYQLGSYNAAAQRFRDAAERRTDNALPVYLQAASLALARNNDAALEDAVELVQRANNRGAKLLFPQPLWHSSLPQQGFWYAELSRDIVAETSAILLDLTARLSAAVDQKIKSGQTENTNNWLQQFEILGTRLANASEPSGTLQALAGTQIQQTILESQIRLDAATDSRDSAELGERKAYLNHIKGALDDFENKREDQIQAGVQEMSYPLRLAGYGFGLLTFAYTIALIAYRFMRHRKSSWTVPHSTLGKTVYIVSALLFFIILHTVSSFRAVPGSQEGSIELLAAAWWAVLGLVALFGPFYPAFILKSAEEVSRRTGHPEDALGALKLARRTFRRAYTSLVLRYYGVLSGVYLCTLCAWIISYRIVNSFYPWQIKLLAPGFLQDEIEIVNEALALLS